MMSITSIVTTVKIAVTKEAVEEEETFMRAAVAEEQKVKIMLIVGRTHIMQAKLQCGIRKMEGTVRKLECQALTMLNYYSDK